MDKEKITEIGRGYEEKYGFQTDAKYVFKSKKGLSPGIVKEISGIKEEPAWMRAFRLEALEIFLKKPMPGWGNTELLNSINFDDIYYYFRPTDKTAGSWEDVPIAIRDTFEKLGIPEAERKFLAGVTSQFDCLSYETLVTTSKGAIPIKDIKVGSLVYSLDETNKKLVLQKVRAVLPKGDLEVFEVNIGGRKVKVTANHPFLALTYTKAPGRQRGRFGTQWKYLSDLKVGDHVAVVKELPLEGTPYRFEPQQISSKYLGKNQFGDFPVDTRKLFNRSQKNLRLPLTSHEPLLWLAGLFMGDGFLYQSPQAKGRHVKDIVDIAIPASELKMRQRLAQSLYETFGYKMVFNGDPYRARIHSVPIASFFAAIGFNGHAHTKRIPLWLFSLPKTQRLAFIAGYIDSDGTLRNGAKNSDCVITSVNRILLRQTQQLAISCGLRAAGPYEFKSKLAYKGQTTTHTAYRLMLTGNLAPLGQYSLKCENFVPRKYTHTFNTAHNSPLNHWTSEELGFAAIRSIKAIGKEPTYDIAVEGFHNFIAEGIVAHNSEAVYHSVQKQLTNKGVIFLDMDSGLKQYPDIVKKYFGTVIPPTDNKFAALNSAVWSGGSLIYVPPGVTVDLPLQAYFRINAKNVGQFERTLIIADKGSSVHYIEGCLPKGEFVSKGDTFVPIDSVRPNDLVANSNGTKAGVLATQKRPYKGTLIQIIPLSVGNAFELTPEHPVLAIPREKVSSKRKNRPLSQWEVLRDKLFKLEPQWVEAGKIKEGDLLCFPVTHEIKDHPELTLDLLRFLGYYLAEGSAFFNRTTSVPVINLSFNIKEGQKINECKDLIFKITGKRAGAVRIPEKHESQVYVYSHELLALCWKYIGRHAIAKTLHRDIMELPPEKQKHLLETYTAGDGSVYERKNGNKAVRIMTISKTLAFQIQELLARQGIYAGINIRKAYQETMKTGRVIAHKELYCVNYTENRDIFQSWYDPKRKCFWVPVRKLKSRLYTGWVFNLEMASAPNSYLAKGFAVHNCTAPVYASNSLHSAVVELIALPGATIRYTTIQNWSKNVFNLVTKRAVAHENAVVRWIDANLGSKLTMKFPSVYLTGPKAHGEILSVAFAGANQHQDAGAKIYHAAPETTSTINSKSVSKDGGRTSYRGLLKVYKGSDNAKASVRCDALMLDESSRSDTYPTMEVGEQTASIAHEATVSKIGDEELFYLMSRGLSEREAMAMIVNGFIEPFIKTLPLEYAVEMNRLIELEMEGAVG